MLEKFNDKISEIFNSRLFFENVIDEEFPHKLTIFSKDDFNCFYENAYVIKDNNFKNILTDDNVLLETVEEVNFNQPVLDLIFNARFGEQILPCRILKKLNKNWIYYKSYEEIIRRNEIPIYVFQFDFNNDLQILEMFYHLMPELRKEDKFKLPNDFKGFVGKSLGLVTSINEKAIIMCLNQPASKKTIAHELCHYFQYIIGILKSEYAEISSDIGSLHLSKIELEYLLNEKEFYSHIYINLFSDMKKFYKVSIYSSLNKNEFLNELFKEVEKYKDEIFKSKLGREWVRTMNEDSSLQILAACCYLNFRYEFIKTKLKSSF